MTKDPFKGLNAIERSIAERDAQLGGPIAGYNSAERMNNTYDPNTQSWHSDPGRSLRSDTTSSPQQTSYTYDGPDRTGETKGSPLLAIVIWLLVGLILTALAAAGGAGGGAIWILVFFIFIAAKHDW